MEGEDEVGAGAVGEGADDVVAEGALATGTVKAFAEDDEEPAFAFGVGVANEADDFACGLGAAEAV